MSKAELELPCGKDPRSCIRRQDGLPHGTRIFRASVGGGATPTVVLTFVSKHRTQVEAFRAVHALKGIPVVAVSEKTNASQAAKNACFIPFYSRVPQLPLPGGGPVYYIFEDIGNSKVEVLPFKQHGFELDAASRHLYPAVQLDSIFRKLCREQPTPGSRAYKRWVKWFGPGWLAKEEAAAASNSAAAVVTPAAPSKAAAVIGVKTLVRKLVTPVKKALSPIAVPALPAKSASLVLAAE